MERHRHGTQDDLHQSQGHRSRGGWKVRPDGRGCPENQIQLPNTTSDSSSRNHPAGGEREAGDVPETLQKVTAGTTSTTSALTSAENFYARTM